MNPQAFRVSPQTPAFDVPEGLSASYANVVRIAHMPSEILIDFALKLPGASPAQVTARVLLSPLHAKLFMRAMTENIAKYEKMFGEIRIPGEGDLAEYTRLFGPPPHEGEPKADKDE